MSARFVSSVNFWSDPETGSTTCTLSDTVPARKRLIVEVVCGAYTGNSMILGAAYLEARGVRYYFPWIQCGSLTNELRDGRFFGFHHHTRLYIDGPTNLI